ITHEEVLIVYTRKVERQSQAVHLAPPHQTGVTERSIGDCDGNVVHDVVDDVMVGKGSDRIGAGVFEVYGEQVFIAIEPGITRGLEWRSADWMKQDLIDIDAAKRS